MFKHVRNSNVPCQFYERADNRLKSIEYQIIIWQTIAGTISHYLEYVGCPMNNEMYHIRKRSPEKSKTIDLLMAEDPEFRAICEDYDDCFHAWQYWVQSTKPEAETRVNEYRTLIKELENEIVEALVAVNSRQLDSNGVRGRAEG